MSTANGCCCTPTDKCDKDCIWGTEIESGCCHKDDVLLFWAERNAYSVKTNSTDIGPDPLNPGGILVKELCCEHSQPQESPIQAIYKYHDCFWRCIKIDITGLQGIDGLAEMCPPATCDYGIDQNGDPYPTPCLAFRDPNCYCCHDPDYDNQQWSTNNLPCCADCNHQMMSIWRKRRMASEDKWKWFVECLCHKNGFALGSGGGCDVISTTDGVNSFGNCSRLYDQALCVVHFERWWKIAECAEGDRIYLPGCTPGPGGFNCGGNIYQSTELVPKWWIFACSGIPLYAGDLIDAVRFGVISSAEAVQVLDDLYGGDCRHPSQAILRKLAVAGYIRANDWRDEQRQAFVELDARFPGAGYGSCIQQTHLMHTLGPFRKRMTYGSVGTSAQPLLRKADVVDNPDLMPLQADCFINYPGPTTGASAQADYDYWAERQWVYFRGRPGGWQWAGWGASDCGGGTQNEELAILVGHGRADPDCIGAFRGSGRSPGTDTPCGCCNLNMPFGYRLDCRGCDYGDFDTSLLPACQPPSICKILSYRPFCEGLHIQYSNYEFETDLRTPGSDPNGNGILCDLCAQNKCILKNNAYLVEARRVVDSWDDAIPFTCRPESPPLPPFKDWPAWQKNHPAPQASICNFAIEPGQDQSGWCWCANPPCQESVYTDRMCCGGMCQDFLCDCVPEAVDPFSGPLGPACPSVTECPPHSTQGQVACIGYQPDCQQI